MRELTRRINHYFNNVISYLNEGGAMIRKGIYSAAAALVTAFLMCPVYAAGSMAFFTSAIDTMKIVVCAIGAGMAVLGIINYLEGYSNDSSASKSQGIKQLMAGGGIFIIGLTLVPLLSTVFG